MRLLTIGSAMSTRSGSLDMLLILFLLIGIAIGGNQAQSEADEHDTGIDPGFGADNRANRPIKLSAFNIQIFGKNKMQQEDVVDILVKILLRYDLILIQEIRDSEQKSTQELLNILNGKCHENDQYEMIISDRLGRSSSKEQYAFFYRSRLLSVKGSFHYDDGEEVEGCITEKEKAKADRKAARSRLTALTRDDDDDDDDDLESENVTQAAAAAAAAGAAAGDSQQKDRPLCQDTFQREPFVVRFFSNTTVVKDFSVVACHTDPDEAVQEIDALYDVYKNVKSRWRGTEVIIAGDLNAGGSFMPRKYWSQIRLRDERYWNWLIPDNADTTTGRTNCAYDRFITWKGGKFEKGGFIPGSAAVFDYQNFFGLNDDLTGRVSDHYPIEIQLQPEN